MMDMMGGAPYMGGMQTQFMPQSPMMMGGGFG